MQTPKWKITKIEITNFKFFKEKFSLEIGRNNLLLYGENGSGKSSIYWSFFTHFQAYSKNKEQGQKYFSPSNGENLRNRYSENTDKSGISVTFGDGLGNTRTIEDSSEHYYPDSRESYDFMRATMMCSDFMNYKFLSSLFDFCNSEENEVFKFFEKEVLPFLDFDTSLISITGEDLHTNNSGDWWNYIKEAPQSIPHKEGDTPKYSLMSDEYKRYIKLIDDFNSKIRTSLVFIEARANKMLKEEFNYDCSVVIDYVDVSFNELLVAKKGARKRDSQLHRPKILLRAKMLVSPEYSGTFDSTTIYHPRSFFNEAKLTCMALAIRLVILNSKTSVENSSPTLFVDDLLISLDMSLRIKVLQILLGYASKLQLFIFTHDRAFFNLIRAEIKNRQASDNWKCFQMFSDNSAERPIPRLLESKSLLDEAKMHLSQFHIPACANSARRFCEQQLKRILPLRYQLKTTKNSNDVFLNLKGLIDSFYNYLAEFDLPDYLLFPSLNRDREYILNPFSHDDFEMPIYRQELCNLIMELEKMGQINIVPLFDATCGVIRQFQLYLSNDGHSITVRFFFKDIFSKLVYFSSEFIGNPCVLVVSSNINSIKCNKQYPLKKIYGIACESLSYNEDNSPSLLSCVSEILDN